MTKQMLAAWKSWWTRPLMVCLMLMIIVYAGVVITFFLDKPARRITDATSSDTFSYKHCLHHMDDVTNFLTSNQSDESIVSIDLRTCTFDGNFVVRQSDTNQGQMLPISDHEQFLARLPNLKQIRFAGGDLLAFSNEILSSLDTVTWAELSPFELSNEHLVRLADLPAIEHLEIYCHYSSADLSLLADIPTLRSLRILENWTRHRAGPAPPHILSMQTIEQISSITALERLTLNFDLIFGEGLVHNEEDEARLAAAFAKMPGLQRLLIGSARPQQEKNILQQLRTDLPNVTVLPARVSRSNTEALLAPIFPLMISISLICLQLISQFSGPPSLLLPGHRTAHLRVLLILLLTILCLTFLLELNLGVAPLAAAAVTLTLIGLLFWLGVAMWNLQAIHHRSQYFRLRMILGTALGFGIIAAMLYGIVWHSHHQPELDWFLSGGQPLLAVAIICVFSPLLPYSCRRFMNLQRTWAEAGASPASTVRQIGRSVTEYYHRFNQEVQQHGSSRTSTRLQRWQAAWSQALQSCQRELQSQPGSIRRFIATIRKRALGDAAGMGGGNRGVRLTYYILMSVYMVTFPALFGVLAGNATSFTDAILSSERRLGVMFFFLAIIATGWVAYSRSALYPRELLQPVSRKQWVVQSLSHIWWDTTSYCLCLWITCCGLRWICGAPSTFPWMVLQLTAVGTYAVWNTAMIGWIIGVHRIWTTALGISLSFCSLLVLVPVLWNGSLSPVISEEAPSFGLVSGVTAIVVWLALSLLTLESVRRYWLKMEFVR